MLKGLLVGESNPGRLRDRQKCHQLHQRGMTDWVRIIMVKSRLRESNSRPPAYKAGAITTMLKRQTDRATGARFELTRAEPSRFRIYRLNHSAKMPCLCSKRWRIRVSIPVPRRCKRRTLPIELIPHGAVYKRRPWQDSNLQPLDPKSSALSIAPQGPDTGDQNWFQWDSNPRLQMETRT